MPVALGPRTHIAADVFLLGTCTVQRGDRTHEVAEHHLGILVLDRGALTVEVAALFGLAEGVDRDLRSPVVIPPIENL